MAHDTLSSRAQPVEDPELTEQPRVVTFGDLVAAAFDRAEVVTTDPDIVATMATRTVGRWLGRTGRPDLARRLQPHRSNRRPRYSRAA
jgi:hypothetical protein